MALYILLNFLKILLNLLYYYFSILIIFLFIIIIRVLIKCLLFINSDYENYCKFNGVLLIRKYYFHNEILIVNELEDNFILKFFVKSKIFISYVIFNLMFSIYRKKKVQNLSLLFN